MSGPQPQTEDQQSMGNTHGLSTSASVGTIAVNAGLALAINRMTQDTKVRGGTEIKAASLNVNGKSATAADSYLTVRLFISGVVVTLNVKE